MHGSQTVLLPAGTQAISLGLSLSELGFCLHQYKISIRWLALQVTECLCKPQRPKQNEKMNHTKIFIGVSKLHNALRREEAGLEMRNICSTASATDYL